MDLCQVTTKARWSKDQWALLFIRRQSETYFIKPTGNKVPISRDLIERGGSTEAWFEAGDGNRSILRLSAPSNLA